MRVLSRVLSPDAAVLNAAKDEKEKIGQGLFLEGKKQTPCKQDLGPGAIVAVAKLKNTSTGDTLCAEKSPFALALPKLSRSQADRSSRKPNWTRRRVKKHLHPTGHVFRDKANEPGRWLPVPCMEFVSRRAHLCLLYFCTSSLLFGCFMDR